ncbi:2-oxoglutarate decarboxylase, thiamin-requiring [Candidatus Terasakiella magnetica]|uniref:2-oxoglutarate dehydrogenase E1 component n=1 Tax=Candidatus Terasakiella magnetica TaxID=1867952 RepID=A0A1C3RIX1_9PROT|nr:2-oxoglutarate dehydrogenase E1 component [Candidatus Terasakiella magnetica]SCA57212.1 2-oxoglutarate decarboxylase, thiamin-requiring [Candidatus Terasakiella magnetica]
MVDTPESVLNGNNTVYLAELYTRYMKDPSSVDQSWVAFFSGLREDGLEALQNLSGPSWNKPSHGVVNTGVSSVTAPVAAPQPQPGAVYAQADDDVIRAATLDSIRALMLIRSYRVRGHLIARFDPLGIEGNNYHPELDPKSYGFTDADMDRPIFIDFVLGLETATLREIVEKVKQTYCRHIGVEFMHIQEPEEKSWIQRRIESTENQSEFTVKGKTAILERLTEAEGFEQFLDKKYTGTKRFGLEGGESLIPAMEQILKRGAQLGLKEVVLGMPHRGRLNVLTNVMHKPFRALFSEFQGNSSNPDDVEGSGDVKYHLGTSADREFDGNNVHLSLTANPSHLELVNPVVHGKVRAKQEQLGGSRSQVMPLLLHGDAAYSGQGIVPEGHAMSDLRGYKVGGTIHIIVNNQIGFTTAPHYSRSSQYPSDVAKMVQAPIFHVNGDDPEAVVHVARIATEYRQEFGKDVVIDLFCYRRHGHNESDEPMFTNPHMYKVIKNQVTTRELYAQRLVAEKVLSEQQVQDIYDDFRARLEEEFQAGNAYKPNKADWFEGKWEGFANAKGEEEFRNEDTSVSEEVLKEVGKAISTAPDKFNVNKKVQRQLKAKSKMIETGEGIDWATGEALAFGSLLVDKHKVRLSGQDCGRGTFSQRHSVIVDQETEERYRPLSNIREGQGEYEVIDSPLIEMSVLGFEYGYSLAEPNALVMWEAQFGDFANGAQMIIDQFISSGESKWLRLSGLTMLLPHGFEGQGPEHSSARPERYLQLCAEDNWQVCNLTTPANYFHALRRQVCRNFRKPLVIMTPKSLLRHKLCQSTLADFSTGSAFKRVIGEIDQLTANDKVKRVVLCTGKVYYDLLQTRRDKGIDDVAIVRVEQLYPWPKETIKEEISKYTNADVVWCQEEPANMGYWGFVFPRLMYICQELSVKGGLPGFSGRRASASPATGLNKVHVAEQQFLVEEALGGKLEDLPTPFARETKMAASKL